MTLSEAYDIINEFYRNPNPDEEEEFIFTEAMGYVISQTNSPEYMLDLGGHYYGKKDYNLALKYYEMAANLGSTDAFNCLGYIWYYGRTGQKDYKKAFENFQKAAEAGDFNSAYKMADMYKNGYYVEKDYDIYALIIEKLYDDMQSISHFHHYAPEIYTRLAGIREKQGRCEDAVELLLESRMMLSMRIARNPFFGNLSIMQMLTEQLYRLIEFDREDFDFYDLYHLLKTPSVVTFRFRNKTFTVESVEEDGGICVCFDGKWFRTISDFFLKAEINGRHITDFYDDFYMFEVS